MEFDLLTITLSSLLIPQGRALTVVFQQWFHVCAEESSCASTVSRYINAVTTESPAVLQFLVNMVDDNGNTALHYSVSHSNFSIVKLLLDTGTSHLYGFSTGFYPQKPD